MTELNDTIKKGTKYEKYGFDISGTDLGDKDFQLQLVNIYGCDSTVTLHLTTIVNDGVGKFAFDESFAVYPNPAREKLIFVQKAGLQATALRLADVSGRVLLQVPVTSAESELSMDMVAPGIYFLGIYDGSRLLGVFKVCKE